MNRFNPTLVRLRLTPFPLRDLPTLLFQSHAGSIEARWRLLSSGFVDRFQSHAGSIEAEIPQRAGPATTRFQSHAGSIEAGGHGLAAAGQQERFNPTLVRLRHAAYDSQGRLVA